MKPEQANDKAAYFNNLGHRWDQVVGNNAERQNEIRNIFKMIRLRPGDRVLDVGCGNGVLFRAIEESVGVNGSITALDAAPAMLEKAKELHAEYSNIKYVAGTIEDMDIAHVPYDAVLCFAVFPHIEDKVRALNILRGSIKPDGRLYLFHLSDTKSLNRFHKNLDSPVKGDVLPEKDELVDMLQRSGFSVITYIDRDGLNFTESLPC
jgi:ubiquinone/menaquinone biosynthesis C-methylase UbiE